MCGRLPAPDLAALQTSTDVSGGRVAVVVVGGVCRITFHRRGPREQARLSLCHLAQCGLLSRTPSPSSLPQPPGPSLRQNYKGPPTAGSSLCPPSFSQTQPPTPLRPASIRRRYSIHRRRALITKQDYGPCLGTTCQGACSLSCLLSTAHTLQRRGLFVWFFGREMEGWLPQTETQSK